MTDKTMVMSARIPLKTKLALSDVDLRKLLENIAELRECGAIEIVGNEIVLPEIQEENGWGEIEDICHDRNIRLEDARKKIKQMLRNG